VNISLVSFEKCLEMSDTGKRHLLLGNGFSIACRPEIFVYKKLFERAIFDDLPRARNAFDALGSTDFERVIKALRDFAAIAPIYGDPIPQALLDADALRETLVRTIASSHPALPSDITEREYTFCRKFLGHFDRIFTLNYDLLLYWTLMHDLIPPRIRCDDGFRKPDDDNEAPYVTWEPENIYEQNVYYLHGALHLFDAASELRKYTWINTGVRLIKQIHDALSQNYFPLFVAEGTSHQKFARIRHSDYLSKAYRSFLPITGSLFIYGHSLAENDDHVLDAIAKGKTDRLFISIYGDPNSDSNRAILRRANSLAIQRPTKRALAIYFYDAASASVWR
jgi:hypothetical protein